MVDELDKEILRILKENSRTPFLKIAKKLKVSEGTIRKRVKKLKAEGIIRAFSLELNPKLEFETVIGIKTKPQETKKVMEKIRESRFEISPVFEVTGKFDIICIGRTSSAKEMNKLLDEIRSFSGVVDTESFTIVGKS